MDKAREEFEAYVIKHKGPFFISKTDSPACWKGTDEEIKGWESDPYDNPWTSGAWWSWQAAYEAGRNASRRPVAIVKTFGKRQAVYSEGDLVRGGFDSVPEAREWAQSNGFEVYP
jgi:hypothetical protein